LDSSEPVVAGRCVNNYARRAAAASPGCGIAAKRASEPRMSARGGIAQEEH